MEICVLWIDLHNSHVSRPPSGHRDKFTSFPGTRVSREWPGFYEAELLDVR